MQQSFRPRALGCWMLPFVFASIISQGVTVGWAQQPPVEAPRPVDEQSVPAGKSHPAPDAATAESPTDAITVKTRPIRQLTAGSRDELESFFDGVIDASMKEKHIAGATVAVVSGDAIIFQKGYGYADVATQKHVDPETTMFRIGSVSKLLTWTAVMQLVEQGKLDLDADVNTYLNGSEVEIPATFDKPITLKSLLTHTPGFEDHVVGLFGRKVEDLKSLGEVLKEQLPTCVRPPGELASYSNHGTALAGYIVERVSGIPWADYIEQNILKPLRMDHTTVRQPEQDRLPADLSQGYKYEQGEFKKQDFEYVPCAPAGSTSASAADMARFMLAHLNDGRLGDAQILKPATARQMRERLFSHDPKLDAMCYGFWELHRNGQRVLHHGGSTQLFHTFFAMLPDQRTGMFVSFNTNTAGAVPWQLMPVFLDRFYPIVDEPRPKTPTGFKERAARFVGDYKPLRHDYTQVAKVGVLFGVANVAVADDDTLLIGGRQGAVRFAEVEPLLFAAVDGQDRILFRENTAGEITHMFLGALPAIAFEKLPWYQTPKFHLNLLGVCVGLLVSAVLGWPFVTCVTRGRLIAGRPSTAMSRFTSWTGWLGAAAILAALGVLGYVFLIDDPEAIGFGLPAALKLYLKVSPVAFGVAAILLLFMLMAWIRGYWRISGRIHFSLVALAAAALVWQSALLELDAPAIQAVTAGETVAICREAATGCADRAILRRKTGAYKQQQKMSRQHRLMRWPGRAAIGALTSRQETVDCKVVEAWKPSQRFSLLNSDCAFHNMATIRLSRK